MRDLIDIYVSRVSVQKKYLKRGNFLSPIRWLLNDLTGLFSKETTTKILKWSHDVVQAVKYRMWNELVLEKLRKD